MKFMFIALSLLAIPIVSLAEPAAKKQRQAAVAADAKPPRMDTTSASRLETLVHDFKAAQEKQADAQKSYEQIQAVNQRVVNEISDKISRFETRFKVRLLIAPGTPPGDVVDYETGEITRAPEPPKAQVAAAPAPPPPPAENPPALPTGKPPEGSKPTPIARK